MDINLGVIFAFVAMFSWGIGDFLIQKTVRKVGDVEALAYIGIIGGILLLPFVILEFNLLFSLANVLVLVLLGIVTFIAALFNFEALKKGKLSVVEIMLEIELPITVVLGFIFFKEKISFLQFFIILLIFLGILLIALEKTSFKNKFFVFEKGVLFALIAALGMGLINFFTAFSSREVSPFMAVWFPWVLFTTLCIFYLIKNKRFNKLFLDFKKFKILIIFMGVFDTLAWLSYASAVKTSNLAVTTAITESYPAIALFLGLFINKERIDWHQYLGAAIAIVCSFLLGFIVS
ncbi:DMT family transporter [Candidatus Woesearchaeota archaeon]|nr:DMT family transporter [Candidatus Woesearchaeota archaeon]